MMTNYLFVMFNASHAYCHSTSVIIQALDAVQHRKQSAITSNMGCFYGMKPVHCFYHDEGKKHSAHKNRCPLMQYGLSLSRMCNLCWQPLG